MSAKLVVHRGAINVSREALRNVATPEGTSSWKPVSHARLVDMLTAEIAARDMVITREEYAIHRQGNVLFGVMDLNWKQGDDYAAAIGLRTSNDKSFAIQLAVGARICVCDNLAFSGDLIALKRRHTSQLDLPKEIAGGLDRYREGVLTLNRGIQQLKEHEIGPLRAKEMIYDIFLTKVVPLKLFHAVANEYTQIARHQGPSLWSMHNAFTTHLKRLSPLKAFRANVELGKLFGLRAQQRELVHEGQV